MTAEITEKDSRLLHAEALIEAIRSGDEAAEARALQALYDWHENSLYSDLNRIAGELRNTLSNIPANNELSRLARSELPDAQLRLRQVLDLTEDAANTSLEAVERALPIVKELAADARRFGERWVERQSAPKDVVSLEELLRMIVSESEIVERCLSDVLLAQGFQDLTGQIIRRVAELVAELERLLSRSPLGEGASPVSGGMSDAERLRRGAGPALPNREDDDRVRGQDDVDDLLGQLGI